MLKKQTFVLFFKKNYTNILNKIDTLEMAVQLQYYGKIVNL